MISLNNKNWRILVHLRKFKYKIYLNVLKVKMPELLNNSEQTIIKENSESSRVDLESKDESMPNKTIKGYQFTKVGY